jgi:hypothetical protein
MSRFELVRHHTTKRDVVEVWENGAFICCIYPATRGVHIVTKYEMEVIKPQSDIPGNSVLVTIGEQRAADHRRRQ